MQQITTKKGKKLDQVKKEMEQSTIIDENINRGLRST
jgi:hypothetical protein